MFNLTEVLCNTICPEFFSSLNFHGSLFLLLPHQSISCKKLSSISRGAHIDVRNKKGNTPLWLAANGGHLDVVQLLVQATADVDAADNRKITPLMAAFRKVVLISSFSCSTAHGQLCGRTRLSDYSELSSVM